VLENDLDSKIISEVKSLTTKDMHIDDVVEQMKGLQLLMHWIIIEKLVLIMYWMMLRKFLLN